MTLKRRLAALIALAALMASLSGCASVFDKEYISAAAYEDADDSGTSPAGDASEVSNYFGLKLAITQMVNAHQETATLNFRRYDGVISEDIASACREVSKGTALGDYCVDYISYDLERIIAYYEAVINVSYKRSADEVASIVRLTGAQTVYDALKEAVAALRPSVVIMGNAADTGAENVSGFVENIWRDSPLICVNKPAVDAKVYSGGGIQRVFEVAIDYGGETEALREKSQQLAERVEQLASGVTAKGEAHRALRAANALLSVCICDGRAGDSAWAALMEGRGDSEGVAVAYKALCDELGVECQVVVGRLGEQRHCWNIIKVSGDWYHADIFRSAVAGAAACFLKNDDAQRVEYYWSADELPACDGELTYSAVFGEEQEEPVVTDRPVVTPTHSPDASPTPTPAAPTPTPTAEVSPPPESPAPSDGVLPEQNT